MTSSVTPAIVVLGSANVDLITYCDEFPKNGGKGKIRERRKGHRHPLRRKVDGLDGKIGLDRVR